MKKVQQVPKPPTLDELTDHVKTTEWSRLGLKLGVEEFDLNVIAKDNPQNTGGAKEAMLKKWLAITAHPTWRTVVDALRAIDEIQLATKLETRYCPVHQMTEKRNSIDNATPEIPRTTLWSKCSHPLITSAVVLVIAALIGVPGLSVWLQWQSNTATSSQTPGQPEATPRPVSKLVPNLNCHRIESKLDLFKELKSIANWEILCFQLGVSDEKIDSIKNTYHSDVANKKKECLDAFYKQGGVCWEKVVAVVSGYPFEDKRLAKEIADRHELEYSVD